MGTRRTAAAFVVLFSGVLIAGCAQDAGGTAEPGASMSATSANQPESLPPGAKASPSPPSQKSPTAGELTITGQVEQGVEEGCLLLTSGGTQYLLVGGDRAVVRAGARVTVRGRPSPGLMTTCQQGLPFQVSEAHPA
jgi:hypothetical protein